MFRHALAIVSLCGAFAASAYWTGADAVVSEASAQDAKDIGGKFRLIRLAVPAGDDVGEILRRDARLSGGFEVLDRKGMPAALIKEKGFNKDGWIQVGADAVIKNAKVGGQIRFLLYDLGQGNRPVLSKGYPAGDSRKAAHKFMNDVIAHYTGVPGVFGSRIAFVRTRRNPTVTKNVYTAEMDGGNVASITNNRSLNILPSIGPGGEVLFTSYAKRNPDLWMAAGGAPRRISKYPGLNLGGVMSPNGGSIALTLSKDGNSEIYLIDRGGNIQRRLTKSPAIDGSPTWSPAGNRIAFVSNRAGTPQIYVMSSSGGGAKRLTRKGKYNQTPDWNPGNKKDRDLANWVAYAGRDNANRFDVFAVHVRTGKLVRLTQGGGRNEDPTYSPDGRLVAYASSRGGIFVATKDGNNAIPVIRAGTTPDWGPRAY